MVKKETKCVLREKFFRLMKMIEESKKKKKHPLLFSLPTAWIYLPSDCDYNASTSEFKLQWFVNVIRLLKPDSQWSRWLKKDKMEKRKKEMNQRTIGKIDNKYQKIKSIAFPLIRYLFFYTSFSGMWFLVQFEKIIRMKTKLFRVVASIWSWELEACSQHQNSR